MITRKSISENLASMGVRNGDVLFVRADIGKIGLIESKKRMDYLFGMLDAVGEDGTLVATSFTKSFFLRTNNSYIFDGTNKSSGGAIANLMLKNERSIRSSHPTNSFVAIGKHASYVLSDHDECSDTFEPIRKIIQLNGKMILIGCVHSGPGFTTTHLAEIDLGLDRKFFCPKLNTVYYKKGSSVLLFRKKDLGSCSSTYYRLYSYYVYHEALIQGYVGNAYSVMIDAKTAYEIDYNVLKKNPKIVICDNPFCTRCRVRRKDNFMGVPLYLFRLICKNFSELMVRNGKDGNA